MSTPQSYNKVDSASPLNAKDSAVKANIEALADLFPAAVQEGVVDFDALTRILGGKTEPQPERFGLNWCGKAAAHAGALVDSAGTLRPCREESKDWDTTKNLYIEGDNLEVLKLLRNSYRGKVKMIYIDPPYNTGKDFVYKDNFHDSIKNYQQITNQQNELKENSETSGRYHTDWLNMMYPRLMLARELLSDDGVIFISIDDNEVDNLKKTCSEIYGEQNFIAVLSIENNPKGRKNSSFISVSSEYCVIYAKNKTSAYFIENVPKQASDMTLDEDGRYVHNSGKRVLVGENSFNPRVIRIESEKNYSVYYRKRDNSLITKKELFAESDTLLLTEGYDKYYSYFNNNLVENTYTDAKLKELHSQRALEFLNGKIYEKNFNDTIRIKSLLVNREYDAIVHGVRKKYSMELTTTGAGTILKQLFNSKDTLFTAPKNPGYLKLLISLIDSKDFIVLDFFSGSASSAHAVMKLNAEDGGNRRFIMVQLPEACVEGSEAAKAGYKNICEIGKERIRRAGEKVKEEAGEKAEGLDIGFRVYKLDSSNVYAWEPDTKDIEKSLEQAANHLKEDRSAEDIMTELMLRFGIKLTDNIEKAECGSPAIEVYNIGCGRHFACLDESLAAHAEEVAHFILEWHKEENPGTHEEEAKDCQVFVVDKAFVGNDAAKKNFCAILSDYGIKQVNAF